MKVSLVAAVVCASVGVGSSGCTSEAGPPGAEDGILAAPPDGAGMQLAMHASLESGQETTICKSFVVPEGERYEVSRFEHRYTEGSHHLLVYRTDMTPEEAAAASEPFDCETSQFAYPVAYAAQAPEGELAFPDDVALFFEPGEVLLVQSHYLNATAGHVEADVRVNLWRGTEHASVEAGTLFFYDWAIVVPPGESTARMHCVVPNDIQLVFAMSHMHRRGVGYDSRIVGAAPEREGSLYATSAWEEVQPAQYEPSVNIRAGSAIDYECHYWNTEDRTIIEGPSAVDNEMCMFVGTYFPKMDQASEACLAPGSGPQFSGTATCSEAIACAQDAADDLTGEQCLVDTCAASSVPLASFGGCMFENCVDVCGINGSGADDCQSCIAYHCVNEYVACSAATCD